jgi:hypothetical protein
MYVREKQRNLCYQKTKTVSRYKEMSDVSHRKCIKVEWQDANSVAGISASNPHHRPMINNVVNASFASVDWSVVSILSSVALCRKHWSSI